MPSQKYSQFAHRYCANAVDMHGLQRNHPDVQKNRHRSGLSCHSHAFATTLQRSINHHYFFLAHLYNNLNVSGYRLGAFRPSYPQHQSDAHNQHQQSRVYHHYLIQENAQISPKKTAPYGQRKPAYLNSYNAP